MDPETFESGHARLFEAMKREKGACPDSDVLFAYLNGDLMTGERRLLEEHLSLCALCSELFDRLQRSEEPVDDLAWKQVESRLEGRAAPWRALSRGEDAPWIRRRYWLAAAACVVLAVAGFVLWNITGTVPISSGPASLTRGAVLQLHEPAGVVSGVRIFRWSSLPLASQFRLEIRRQGQVIWEATAQESRYRPPAELSMLLPAGERFEWRVEALDEDGEPVAESSWMAFERSP